MATLLTGGGAAATFPDPEKQVEVANLYLMVADLH